MLVTWGAALTHNAAGGAGAASGYLRSHNLCMLHAYMHAWLFFSPAALSSIATTLFAYGSKDFAGCTKQHKLACYSGLLADRDCTLQPQRGRLMLQCTHLMQKGLQPSTSIVWHVTKTKNGFTKPIEGSDASGCQFPRKWTSPACR